MDQNRSCASATAIRSVSAALLVSSLAFAATGAQVRRQVPGAKSDVPMDVSLQIGSVKYASSAAGTCSHADMASLYNVRAEMWRVEQSSGDRSVTLTLWNPKDASEQMLNFAVSGGTNERVSIVRGQPNVGSGKVVYQPSGKGGTFTLTLKTDKGSAVTGTIKCSAFTPVVAEGGH